ncbi:MAG: TldD/PmbA family protein, partial [Candidatus Hydrogenedentes bacterium]|nr:TldD/PmbA family protein [Candidatus Hydrogenedentota bacterium]
MPHVNNGVVAQILDAARRLGAAEAEVFISREVEFSVEVAKGEVETLSQAESVGLGVRVLTQDKRTGFAYAAELTEGSERVVNAAWQNALANDPDPHSGLPQDACASDDNWTEEDFARVSVADKISLARELEAKTLAADTRVSQVERAAYSDGSFEVTIANTYGLCRWYRNSYCTCSVAAVAAESGVDSEMGWEFDFARKFNQLQRDKVAADCANHATRLLGGKPCATGTMPVVLDNLVTMQFLGIIGPALMANHVLKGKSLFVERVGESIAAPCVTLADQNDFELGINRAPFDGEGVSASSTVLVQDGTLRGFLQNSYTAHKMGEQTTANAGRGSFRSQPDVGATNFYLEPGTLTQAQLLDRAGDGFFVTEILGAHTADPISGEFSVGAAGLLIKKGRLASPVRGV